MSLNSQEIQKINNLYTELDKKDGELRHLREQLYQFELITQNIQNMIQENKNLISEVNTKIDSLLSANNKRKTTKEES